VNLFPLATFDAIEQEQADTACAAWGHYLGACDRPFGLQWFGLFVAGDLVSVAVSASTVSGSCGGWPRDQVVELARLVTRPSDRWATRVCLRLWRELAPRCWRYWRVRACVSYQSAIRHSGNVYRFDGWTRVAELEGSGGGGTWSTPKERERKVLWVYELPEVA
jgi:hypothetical protein